MNFDKISIHDIILSHWHPDHVGGTKEVLKSAEVTRLKRFEKKNQKNNVFFESIKKKSCGVHKFPRSDGEEPYTPFSPITGTFKNYGKIDLHLIWDSCYPNG